MAETPIDAAIIDLKMPGMDGLTLLVEIKRHYPHIQTMMLTGHGNIQQAVAAIQLGAVDFIEKPFVSEKIVASIQQLNTVWQLERENRQLKQEITAQFNFDRLIGKARKMLELKKMISRIGPFDETVLIQGETGSGKEVIAKAIHHHSNRSDQPFVVVDCTTINETMLESELFGHLKGAFTGAHAKNRGLVSAADKGTLFLDEIGELPLSIQGKLLRLLQEKEIRPVGSSRSIKVNVRILAAANSDLDEKIRQKTFREDLYYRLMAVTLHVPPLRDRIEDIHLLVEHFIAKHRSERSIPSAISNEALTLLESYNWPGNIRELENVIRRILALGIHQVIQPEDLPTALFHPPRNEKIKLPAEDSLKAYEKAAIENALKKSGNNRKKAARLLKIGEATLYRKIKQLHLARHQISS